MPRQNVGMDAHQGGDTLLSRQGADGPDTRLPHEDRGTDVRARAIHDELAVSGLVACRRRRHFLRPRVEDDHDGLPAQLPIAVEHLDRHVTHLIADVDEVTLGHPPRSFAEFARDYAPLFA